MGIPQGHMLSEALFLLTVSRLVPSGKPKMKTTKLLKLRSKNLMVKTSIKNQSFKSVLDLDLEVGALQK